VAESKNRDAAIFLLPVWPVALPGRSFLQFSARMAVVSQTDG